MLSDQNSRAHSTAAKRITKAAMTIMGRPFMANARRTHLPTSSSVLSDGEPIPPNAPTHNMGSGMVLLPALRFAQ